jgi:hypothetical protein
MHKSHTSVDLGVIQIKADACCLFAAVEARFVAVILSLRLLCFACFKTFLIIFIGNSNLPGSDHNFNTFQRKHTNQLFMQI